MKTERKLHTHTLKQTQFQAMIFTKWLSNTVTFETNLGNVQMQMDFAPGIKQYPDETCMHRRCIKDH